MPRCSLYVLINSFESFLQTNPSWLIRSSSRKNPAKPKTSASPSVLVMEKSSRPRAICSTCSSRRMLCRPGNAGRRSRCDPKAAAVKKRRGARRDCVGPFSGPAAPLPPPRDVAKAPQSTRARPWRALADPGGREGCRVARCCRTLPSNVPGGLGRPERRAGAPFFFLGASQARSTACKTELPAAGDRPPSPSDRPRQLTPCRCFAHASPFPSTDLLAGELVRATYRWRRRPPLKIDMPVDDSASWTRSMISSAMSSDRSRDQPSAVLKAITRRAFFYRSEMKFRMMRDRLGRDRSQRRPPELAEVLDHELPRKTGESIFSAWWARDPPADGVPPGHGTAGAGGRARGTSPSAVENPSCRARRHLH